MVEHNAKACTRSRQHSPGDSPSNKQNAQWGSQACALPAAGGSKWGKWGECPVHEGVEVSSCVAPSAEQPCTLAADQGRQARPRRCAPPSACACTAQGSRGYAQLHTQALLELLVGDKGDRDGGHHLDVVRPQPLQAARAYIIRNRPRARTSGLSSMVVLLSQHV